MGCVCVERFIIIIRDVHHTEGKLVKFKCCCRSGNNCCRRHTHIQHIAARQMTIFEMGFSLLVDTFTRKKGEGVECNISPDVKVDIDIIEGVCVICCGINTQQQSSSKRIEKQPAL